MNPYRWHVAIAHTAIILWQVYIAAFAFRTGDQLASLLGGLGAEVGPGVAMFLATHRWWLIVPLVFAILAIAAVRRLDEHPMFSVGVLGAEVVAAVALNIWWREAWFGPILSLMKQVG